MATVVGRALFVMGLCRTVAGAWPSRPGRAGPDRRIAPVLPVVLTLTSSAAANAASVRLFGRLGDRRLRSDPATPTGDHRRTRLQSIATCARMRDRYPDRLFDATTWGFRARAAGYSTESRYTRRTAFVEIRRASRAGPGLLKKLALFLATANALPPAVRRLTRNFFVAS
ncbi:MAG: hypothetical protein HOY78_39025 [Saccharothrix sp.]|nr:hypothetical protein [Saccharothrix sp.]